MKITNKLATATLVSGAMLLAANKPNTAQAADVNDNNSNVTKSEVEQKAAETATTVTKEQAQADVKEAQNQKDVAQSKVTELQTKAEEAEKDTAAAQQKVADATKAHDAAQETIKEATPERIEQVKNNIESQQQEVANQQANQDQAQKEFNQKSQDLTKAQNALNDAKNAETTAQSNANAANQAVKDAQSALNANKNEIAQAQQNVNNAENHVLAVEKTIQDANANKTNLENNLDQANNAVSQAQKDFDAKSTALDQANAKVNEAELAKSQLQSNVDYYQAKVDAINTITMPANYLHYNKWGGADSVNAEEAHKGLTLNHYKNDLEAAKEEIKNIPNPNGEGTLLQLTDAQQKELTLWTANLLNGVRKQLGFKDTIVVTQASLDFAKYVATHSTVEGIKHDQTAIEEADKMIGGARQTSESLGLGGRILNMDDAKESIYSTILEMLFDDDVESGGWGHAFQLSGMDFQGFPSEYLGVAFRPDTNFVIFDSFYPLDEEKANKGGFFTIPDDSELQTKLAEAKAQLAPKQVEYEMDVKGQENAKVAYNNASAHLMSAKNHSASLNKAIADVNSQLSKMNIELAKAKTSAESAKTTLATLTAPVAEKETNVAKAKDKFDVAVADLHQKQADVSLNQKLVNSSKDAYNKAQFDLNNAKNAVKQAQSKLNGLKERLASLQNAKENEAEAANRLNTAKAELEEAQKASEDAQASLTDAKNVLAEKEADLEKTKAVLAKIETEEAAKQAVEKAQEEAKKAAEEKAENTNFYKAGDQLVDSKGQVMPVDYTVRENKVYDSKSVFIGVVSSKVQSRVVARAIAKVESKEDTHSVSTYVPKHAEVKASSVLPSTGTKNTNVAGVIGLAIASVGSLLGLGASKRKEER